MDIFLGVVVGGEEGEEYTLMGRPAMCMRRWAVDVDMLILDGAHGVGGWWYKGEHGWERSQE